MTALAVVWIVVATAAILWWGNKNVHRLYDTRVFVLSAIIAAVVFAIPLILMLGGN